MLAMAFVVVMPTAMQFAPAMHAVPAMHEHGSHHAMGHAGHSPHQRAPTHVMEWCGYCAQLHHTPLFSASTVVWLPLASPATILPVAVPERGNPSLLRLAAAPRGPPIRPT